MASLCRAFFSISDDVREISSPSLWSRIFNIRLLISETRFVRLWIKAGVAHVSISKRNKLLRGGRALTTNGRTGIWFGQTAQDIHRAHKRRWASELTELLERLDVPD
jgi:hypothetical protein